jgi:hypothetical protein
MIWEEAESPIKNTASTLPSSRALAASSASRPRKVVPPGSIPFVASRVKARVTA